jgi:quinol monooxygenase YgiN
MADHATVVDVERFWPADGKAGEVLIELRRVRDLTDHAPGCFGAQVCRSQEDPEILVLISRWKDDATAEQFGRSPDLRAALARVDSLLARPRQAEHFRPL